MLDPIFILLSTDTTTTILMANTVKVTRLLSLAKPVFEFKGAINAVSVEPKFGTWLKTLEEHFSREPNLVPMDVNKLLEAKGFIPKKEEKVHL